MSSMHQSLVEMSRFVLSTFLLFIGLFCNAQTFEWPICGHHSGEGIISQPQQYIEGRLNYEELYISAPLGEVVVSPVEGYISDLYVAEKKSRFEMKYWDIRKGSFDETISNIIQSEGFVSPNTKYLSGYVSIKTSDGIYIQIGGLRGEKILSTGMHIDKGEIIGNVGYDYKAFSVPHISLTIRNAFMDPQDPLKPFGLQSHFIAPKESKAPEKLSQESAKEDLHILFDAYQECYPQLFERISHERFLSYRDSCIASLGDTIDYVHFYYMVRATTTRRFINDSHLSLLTPIPVKSRHYLVPQYRIGVLGDSLIVVSAPQGMSRYLTKSVKSINGMDKTEWMERMNDNMNLYDGDALSSKCCLKLDGWNLLYGENVHSLTSQRIAFNSGETIHDKWVVNNTVHRIPSDADAKFYFSKKAESTRKRFSFDQPCDSILRLTLNTFSMDEEEYRAITDTLLLSGDKYPNLIIDLRNNAGGDEEVMGRLLSIFVKSSIEGISPYNMVNDTCSYQSFRYSNNFPEGAKPFSDYTYDTTKGGYCKAPAWIKHVSIPSPSQYQGKIYMITGESTFSAAALFASYLVRADRAVSVGRETPTAYHAMRADKFIDLRLPNSKIDIRIPLVKCVFDEIITERTPANRGLIPDYPIPISFSEVYCDTNDMILEETVRMINQKKYIERPLFSSSDNVNRKKPGIPLICFIILSLSAIIIIWQKHK